MGELGGVGVVVTRAMQQSASLTQMLLDHGATVHVLPMLRYERVVTDDEKSCFAKLDTYQWILFTSANAVEFFVRALDEAGKELDVRGSSTRIASIGPATTAALEAYDLAPAYESQGQTGADLMRELADLEGNRLASARILLPRSRLADGELPQALRAVGAEVHELTMYDTLPELRNGNELGELVSNKEAQALLFASPSAVDAAIEALGDQASKVLKALKIFSIGPKTSKRCAESRLTVAGEAESHTSAGLVEALVRYFEAS